MPVRRKTATGHHEGTLMNSSQSVKPEVLLSITRVARLAGLPSESVRRAIRSKQLRAEAVVLRGRLGVAVPLSAVVEHWNLSADLNREIELEARQGDINSPVPIITRLVTGSSEPSEAIAPRVSKPSAAQCDWNACLCEVRRPDPGSDNDRSTAQPPQAICWTANQARRSVKSCSLRCLEAAAVHKSVRIRYSPATA